MLVQETNVFILIAIAVILMIFIIYSLKDSKRNWRNDDHRFSYSNLLGYKAVFGSAIFFILIVAAIIKKFLN